MSLPVQDHNNNRGHGEIYAPLRGFEKHLSAMKADPELQDLLSKHSMVDDALGELEVAIKLHYNNTGT